ncbi:hypothetical protein FAM09_17565 [Niastella caeni]|uniref:Uncharacterized protein n=1 Tax=Niastella caeni TaxID=2569763 RepID=A0A4S8HT48_9BACT|nr:hypothetical protein [Niastella caeni]THU38475.1 hypothetical protein FAM09_17565 [Niastella caeni]
MQRKDAIEIFFNKLSGYLYDIKAETLANQALQHNLHPDDFVVLPDGRFYREYRTDVYAVNKIEDSRLHQLLQLRLSRSGLYDLVPEGLFHQAYNGAKANSSAAEMAAQSRIDRKKEVAARKFFQPVEHSFFRQRVLLEQEEENLLAGMDNGLLNDYFFTFWEFPEALNRTSAMLLVLLLPYAHAIAGNLALMQDCLEILLQEKVTISLIPAEACQAPGNACSLGMGELGNDLVCGQTFTEDYPCLQYNIGPLQNSKPVDYCTGGDNDLLLQVFNNYFAPAEADIIINVEIDRARALVELSADESPILGYAAI